MLEKVKWLTDVYQNLRKTFYKIELISKLPGKVMAFNYA